VRTSSISHLCRNDRRGPVRVKGGCGRSAGGAAGVPPASEITPPVRDLRFVPRGDVARLTCYEERPSTEAAFPDMDETDPEYWPTQLQGIFAAIGVALGERRLTPDTLRSVRLPNDEFTICHVSAEEAGWKRGHYRISMAGGEWKFRSGTLEKLSRAAVKKQSALQPHTRSD